MGAAAQRWAASGAMALTGDPRGAPLVAPDGVVERIEALGTSAGVDALGLLGERAAIAGFGRRGSVSCGGASRMLDTADGWVAVTLARPDDIELVPAWLELDGLPSDPWSAVDAAAAQRDAHALVERGRLLGLPVAVVGEVAPPPQPVHATCIERGRRRRDRPPIVADLSSLWAGPLCARILREAGARVIKVESVRRPDGARNGPPAFFDLLHAGHEAVAVDFASEAGRADLRALLLASDVVIEGSRPRALEQLGIDARELLASGPSVWVSITGYGHAPDLRDRVAFGDDAAAAGGLVACVDGDRRPRFVADAVADPLTGVAAAGAVQRALHDGGAWLLDVAMASVASWVAGDRAAPWEHGTAAEARPPAAPRPASPARPLGADTEAVLAELRHR